MTTAPQTPRRALEDAIEVLIAVLDTIDPDPDIEPNGDEEDGHADDLEPSLGGGGYWTDAGLMYDLEQDTADDEYSLGWTISGAHSENSDYEHDPAELGEPEAGI